MRMGDLRAGWSGAAAAGARRWWRARNRREQMLLATFAGLLAVAFLVGFVIRPLQSARAGALASLRTSDTIQNRILASGPASAAPAVRRTGEMAAIAGATAASFGLTVQSIQSAGSRTRIRIATGRYDDLIRWLADLSRTTDARVERMVLARGAAPGTVTADLLVTR